MQNKSTNTRNMIHKENKQTNKQQTETEKQQNNRNNQKQKTRHSLNN